MVGYGVEWLTGEPGMLLIIKELVTKLAKLREATTDSITQAVEANLQGLFQGDLDLSQGYAGL